MQRHGVLFVRDPVIAMDAADILAAKLEPILIRVPKSREEATDMMKGAVCVVTDTAGYADIKDIAAALNVPHLYLGDEDEMGLSNLFARIEQPFTNTSVIHALTTLGLIL